MEDASKRIPRLVDAVVNVAGHLDLPGVLREIVEAACALVGARYAALGVLSEDDTLEQFVHTGLDATTVERIGPLPSGKGVLGELIAAPQPLRLRDLGNHPSAHGFPRHHPDMRSFLGTPIRVAGTVFGNLYLTEKQDGEEFTEDDEELVVALAAIAGVAIHNARLHEATRERERWLEAVREVTYALLEHQGEQALLAQIARTARQLVTADVATIAVPFDADELHIRVADGSSAGELAGVRFPVEPSVSGEVMRSGRPMIVVDIGADPRTSQPVIHVGGFGPAMFVPLSSRGAPVGTLMVANRSGGRVFTGDDVRLVEILAGHASIAIHHQRVEALARRMELIEERERIGQDLQQSAVRRLLGVSISLEQLATRMAGEETDVRRRLNAMVDDIDSSLVDIRRMLFARADRADESA